VIIFGIVYKITNLITGRIYVGKTEHDCPEYFGSGIAINYAINKYGKDHFNKVIIDIAYDLEDLNNKEKFWIKFYDSRNPKIGYNVTEGGDGCKHWKGKKGNLHPRFGKTCSEEHKQKVSETKKGKCLSEEHKRKVGRKGEKHHNYGKHLSEEQKLKISKTRKEFLKNKENHPSYGKHRSEESKQRMKLAQTERWRKFREKGATLK
jgi:group I intron endonuclease